jgi:hypothetical protein
MMRDEWQFEYLGGKLAEAARARLEHHKARFQWWLAK